jgi:hypothetical protein
MVPALVSDGAPEHGPAAHGVTPQVRHPLLVLLGERTVLPGLTRCWHAEETMIIRLSANQAPVKKR